MTLFLLNPTPGERLNLDGFKNPRFVTKKGCLSAAVNLRFQLLFIGSNQIGRLRRQVVSRVNRSIIKAKLVVEVRPCRASG